ncbi:hypothetical protein DAPPUDRAFT_311751 [Daphnia pulex]|uniref:Uncharacterized protein n=1 Tax=Daphnia pulex TaxID=6669 RepID=E9FXT6_DAPPU|nr:hypothetical protein DAPPUDRAFT_311751 [Daphnia pulex]|eukprot:EFX88156.1 hypothetical protein DAPPUDRAFT_311751 [Daphnia pulex]
MGESISKSEISVNSNQRSVLVPKTKAVLVSENIQPKLLNHNSNCKGKKRITIQEYRKQIGHTVINQLSTEKLGITAKPESNLEEKCRGQSPNPDRATCPLCGHVMATFASLVANLAHRSALGFFSLYYPQSTGLVEASVAYLSVIAIGVFHVNVLPH